MHFYARGVYNWTNEELELFITLKTCADAIACLTSVQAKTQTCTLHIASRYSWSYPCQTTLLRPFHPTFPQWHPWLRGLRMQRSRPPTWSWHG
jgi:hypothetical protein